MTEMTDEQRAQMQEKLKSMTPEQIAQMQKEQCIFCQIISGKIPSKKVYEDQVMIAILDINPATKGHVLLVPKTHYMILPHVPDGELAHLFVVAQKLSQSILRVFKVGGTTLFIANGQVAGQRAQHVMVHLIPRREGDKVMIFDEKLIGSEMATKVQMAVKGTFFKHLGIESGDETAEKENNVTQSEKSEQRNHPKKGSGSAADSTIPEPAPYKDSPSSSEVERVKPQKATKKTSSLKTGKSERKIADVPSNEAPKRKDDDVSLDDIANLFK